MPKIYCVEDDESIRELILYALCSSEFEAVGFQSGEEMFEALKKNGPPSLLLLDIMLPGEDGLSVLTRLRHAPATQTLPVILLTAKSAEYDKVKGLDLGADDYMAKPFGVMELLSRVRAVLRRTGVEQSADILSDCGVSLDFERREVVVNGQKCPLTYKEFELLAHLMRNRGIVLSRSRLMDAVWGFDFEGESRTVDMHVKTLRQKLEAAGAPKVIQTVRSVGYKWEELS